ncbi:MAG: flagellar protein FlgN [Lachnospiraceae bacterium]|jgi:flagellar biosynthesis/type III secretory pathway chaperone|nr:flagellar protein FlgN [Lachnospiraceae bacterium]
MAGLIDELVNTMSQENDIYKELIPIADEKTRVIIKNDLDALQKITEQEQLTIEKINALEKKREEVIINIGTVLSRNPKDLNMKELIKIMGRQPEEQKKLSKIHDELSDTLKRLVTINDRNKELIKQSLEMIEFNMNLIQSTRMAPGVNNYTRSAGESSIREGSTGMFDTKQ